MFRGSGGSRSCATEAVHVYGQSSGHAEAWPSKQLVVEPSYTYDNAMLPKRRTPTHPPVVESADRPVIIFVTVCTHKRKAILANMEGMHSLTRSWRMAGEWLVGRFVIMPDHIHLFCSPATQNPCSLGNWVVYWKSLTSKNWPRREDYPIWQKDFWDRQLRREESYGDKWEYVRCNPVRHGLVALPEQWPYQGEQNTLRWE